MGSQAIRFTIFPLVASTIMSSEDQKMFKRFTHLDPSRFSVLWIRILMSPRLIVVRSFIIWVRWSRMELLKLSIS